jgi:hypothetical protein
MPCGGNWIGFARSWGSEGPLLESPSEWAEIGSTDTVFGSGALFSVRSVPNGRRFRTSTRYSRRMRVTPPVRAISHSVSLRRLQSVGGISAHGFLTHLFRNLADLCPTLT